MKKIAALLAVVFFVGVCWCSAPPAFAAGDSALTLSDRTMPRPVANVQTRLIKKSYLAETEDGFMRVAYDTSDSENPEIVVEYYDDQMNYLRGGTVPIELPIWGGFYAGKDAYYIVEGQNNEAEDNSAEVIRVIKYDKNWKRLGAAAVTSDPNRFGGEVRYPFDVGNVSIAEAGGNLFIATGHEGYVDSNIGQGHQGLLIIAVDTDTMTASFAASNLQHSFSQCLAREGNDIYHYEQSEGRECTQLSAYDATTRKSTGFCAVFDYGGERTDSWAVPCYASVDDVAVSASNVLGIGTSIDQTQYANVTAETAHNIYLTVTPRNDLTKAGTRQIWLTDYQGDGHTFTGLNLTKINDDRFLVCWEEKESEEDQEGGIPLGDPSDPLSHWRMHYLFINGSGDVISDVFTQRASLCDCHPIVKNGKVVYFASLYNTLDFYTIDGSTGAFTKKVHRPCGEHASWDFADGVLSVEGTGEITMSREVIYKPSLSYTFSAGYHYYDDDTWKYIRDDVSEVRISEGISVVGDLFFNSFANMTKVTLPESLVKIGSYAFAACTSLESLQIPDGVTEFGTRIITPGKISAKCTSPAIQYAKNSKLSYTEQHKIGEPVYTWLTDNKECKGWAPCEYNPKHGRKEIAQAIIQDGWYVAEFTKKGFEKQMKKRGEDDPWWPNPGMVDLTGDIGLEVDDLKAKEYTGSPRKQKLDVWTYDDNLTEGTDYQLTYENNVDVGRATVIITGIGKYYGSVKKTFKIIPKRTSLTSVKKAKRAMKVKWKKQDVQTTGYEIQYSRNSWFYPAKTVKIKSNKITRKTIKKLKSKKQYYVQVRTYTDLDGKTYYSKWSKTMKVKVK